MKNLGPDIQKVTLTFYRRADEAGTEYAVNIERANISEDAFNKAFLAAVDNEDTNDRFYAYDFETCLDLALQCGDLFPDKEWVG